VPADEATAELYKVAVLAQETRKKAPELYVSGTHTDERAELVARYAKDCVDPYYNPMSRQPRQYAEQHAYFISPKKASIMAHKGYIPVLDEHNLHVQHEGDLLFKIPREMYLAKELSSSNASKVIREGQTDEEIEKLRVAGGKGSTIESSVTTEKLN